MLPLERCQSLFPIAARRQVASILPNSLIVFARLPLSYSSRGSKQAPCVTSAPPQPCEVGTTVVLVSQDEKNVTWEDGVLWGLTEHLNQSAVGFQPEKPAALPSFACPQKIRACLFKVHTGVSL